MTDSKRGDTPAAPRRAPGRPRAFDHEAVLRAAMELFWRDGYAATAVPTLSDATGLSTSSLYNAFGSKLDLFEAALDRYLDRVIERMLGPMARGSAGLADIDAFLGRLGATLALDPPRGCMAVNAIAEFRDPPPGVARRTRRYRVELRRSLRAALDRAASRQEIPAESVAARTEALVPVVIAFNLLVTARAPTREARQLLRVARSLAAG